MVGVCNPPHLCCVASMDYTYVLPCKCPNNSAFTASPRQPRLYSQLLDVTVTYLFSSTRNVVNLGIVPPAGCALHVPPHVICCTQSKFDPPPACSHISNLYCRVMRPNLCAQHPQGVMRATRLNCDHVHPNSRITAQQSDTSFLGLP